MPSTPTRAALYLTGAALIGVGISTLLASGLGVAPQDALNSGLSHSTGLAVGTCSWIVAAAILAAAWATGRRPRAGTILASFIIGAVINLTLPHLGTPDGITAVAYMAGAFTLIYTGITASVTAAYGAGPAEELMLALHERYGAGIHHTRWGIEAALLAAGWVLGGEIGVGTVIFVAATGPVLARTIPAAHRHFDRHTRTAT